MALRRAALDAVGPFDEALDVGTPSRSGGDAEFFARVLARGYRIVYEPAALNWHYHRRTWDELRRKLFGYAVGVSAAWTSSLLRENEVSVLRPCWIMGPSYWDHVVRMFARPVVTTLLGYDPLLQFLHEEDCLRAFTAATLGRHPGVFNLAGRGVLPLSTVIALAGKRSLPMPVPLFYRMLHYPAQGQTGDPPAGFYDYLRYLWVADGERGWQAFGEPLYTTREAWISFVSSRRLRRYR